MCKIKISLTPNASLLDNMNNQVNNYITYNSGAIRQEAFGTER